MENATAPPLRILFVDDDPNLLAALHQKLHSLKGEWAMTFARSGEEALTRLRESPQDVVVSDATIPEVDGPAGRTGGSPWPTVVRIVLSGQSDGESALRSIGAPGHGEVCDPAQLRAVVQRAVAVQRLIKDERIQVVVARMDTIPSAPVLLAELMTELAKPECSLIKAGEIISRDVGMTAKILRIVNSAYFGFRSRISDPVLAVRFLGINTISSLVMACHIFKHADPVLADWLGLNRIWNHSLLTSQWAKRIAESETKDRNLIDDALAAGLLHDVGRLVLAINFPDTYKILIEHARSAREALLELEGSVIGVTHAEIGAYLMGTWGLHNTIVEAIAYHHEPGRCEHRGFVPLTAVHAACALEKGSCSSHPNACDAPDARYLESKGFLGKLDDWRALCEDRPPTEVAIALE